MLWFLLFFSLFTITLLLGQLNNHTRFEKDNSLLKNLTVVIPFRNEEKNLPDLLKSIAKQSRLPKAIYFINDHSEDASTEILNKQLVIDLKDEYGKKAALRMGIEKASTEYILTLDADCVLNDEYFEQLSKIILQDAHILPVMIKNQPYFGFFNLDYYYLFAINSGMSYFHQQIVASGANFLFKREIYLQFARQDVHQTISSGDDTYFLKFIADNRYKITNNTDKTLAISTYLPNIFESILQQRIRWIKKSSSLNLSAVIFGTIGLLYHFGFIFFCFINSKDIFSLFLCKLTFDWLLFYPYLNAINAKISLLKIFNFSVLYPFWIIFIGISSLIIQPKWKGRKITT